MNLKRDEKLQIDMQVMKLKKILEIILILIQIEIPNKQIFNKAFFAILLTLN